MDMVTKALNMPPSAALNRSQSHTVLTNPKKELRVRRRRSQSITVPESEVGSMLAAAKVRAMTMEQNDDVPRIDVAEEDRTKGPQEGIPKSLGELKEFLGLYSADAAAEDAVLKTIVDGTKADHKPEEPKEPGKVVVHNDRRRRSRRSRSRSMSRSSITSLADDDQTQSSSSRRKSSSVGSSRRYSVTDSTVSHLTEGDFREAEAQDIDFLPWAHPPTQQIRKDWQYRVGQRGLGYYYQSQDPVVMKRKRLSRSLDLFFAGARATGSSSSQSSSSQSSVQKNQKGWGSQAMAALRRDDAEALRKALVTTSVTQEHLVANLMLRVKGGNSFYYGDVRVLSGIDSNPLPPFPGDTILHLALRHQRSIPFIAMLLKLGADRRMTNNCGETPLDIDPIAMQRADAILLKDYGLADDDDPNDDPDDDPGEHRKMDYTRVHTLANVATRKSKLPTRARRVSKGLFV